MPRKYEQRRRAEQQDETRQRIVDAAVSLHREIGPARTTLSAVAERAGVQRNTLYRHFPDERALLLACSAQHVGEQPLPRPEGWLDVADPVARCRLGLGELYAHYEADEQMTERVLRDAEVDPLVAEISSSHWAAPSAAIRAALLSAWPDRGAEVEATLDLSLSFATWQSLVRRSGLNSAAAADLMARSVACAASWQGAAHERDA